MPAAHVTMARAAHPRLPAGRGQGGFRQGELQHKQLKKLFPAAPVLPLGWWGHVKASCTPPHSWYPQEPPGTGLGYPGSQREEERSLPCGRGPGCSPRPHESGQAQEGANGCAPSSRLGQH